MASIFLLRCIEKRTIKQNYRNFGCLPFKRCCSVRWIVMFGFSTLMKDAHQSAEDIADKTEYTIEETAYSFEDDHSTYFGFGLTRNRQEVPLAFAAKGLGIVNKRLYPPLSTESCHMRIQPGGFSRGQNMRSRIWGIVV